jgi:hypothetical protein
MSCPFFGIVALITQHVSSLANFLTSSFTLDGDNRDKIEFRTSHNMHLDLNKYM